MKVLVTGAAGQVGSEMAWAFDAHAPETDVVAMGSEAFDVSDVDSVSEGLARVRPDVVVNCAAYTAVDDAESQPDLAYAVNAEGPKNLARCCRAQDTHLVHISTDYVFDGEKPTPYLESDAPNPRSVYGHSKLAGEEAMRAEAGRWTIVRTAWVIGNRGRSFLDAILRRAVTGETLKVVDDQVGSPTFARDLAAALVEVAAHRIEGLLHVTNSGQCTWHELACQAIELAGLHTPIEAIGTVELGRPAPRPRNSVLHSERCAQVGLKGLRPYTEALTEIVPLVARRAEDMVRGAT